MDSSRKIERMFYKCPEVNCRDYDSFPLLDEDDYMGMCSDFSLHLSEICMFIFVRNSVNYGPYVDIYVWDVVNFEGYDHFVICDGFRLPEELETKFLEYAYCGKMFISVEQFFEVNQKIIKTFPQWHYKNYSVEYLYIALQHMYYASHSSGPREILFKAEGLEYIAANMDKLNSFNILGTTPSAIIDKEIPLKLLRILNRKPHFELLCEPDDCAICKGAYKKYSSYFGKEIPSAGQWNYILELYKNGGTFGGYGFKKEIYDNANNFVDPEEIDAYNRYFLIKKNLNIPGKFFVPDFDEIWSALEEMDDLLMYKKGNTYTDKLISARKTDAYRYEYSNKDYEIIMPSSAYDICEEGFNQHNCASNYISDHAEGETTILFLRKKESPNISFVTMEVGADDEIHQVYGRFNTLPQKDVYEFIVEYAKARVFFYDMRHLILENIHKIEESDSTHGNELVEFALSHRCPIMKETMAKTESVNAIEYHQIDLDEYFNSFVEGF